MQMHEGDSIQSHIDHFNKKKENSLKNIDVVVDDNNQGIFHYVSMFSFVKSFIILNFIFFNT